MELLTILVHVYVYLFLTVVTLLENGTVDIFGSCSFLQFFVLVLNITFIT